MSAIPRAVLDTNVIFSRVLHELFGRLSSESRLFNLIWSDELLGEARRVLIERKSLSPDGAEQWVGYMRRAFRDGRVETPNLQPSGLTTDPGDEHVCALAIAGGADYLLTFDRGYLHERLRAHGVEVVSPDTFLAEQLEREPEAIGDVLTAQLAAWGGGARTLDELLAAIERAGAVVFAGRARASEMARVD